MAGILIYSEKKQLALEILTAAKVLANGSTLGIKAVSINNDEEAQELAFRGVDTYKINSSDINLADTVAIASALNQAANKLGADLILCSSNRRGKELAGRLAQLLDAGCLTDVSSLKINSGKIECVRDSLGGATLSTQVIRTDRKVIAIAPKSFAVAEESGGGSIKDLSVAIEPSKIQVIKKVQKTGNIVDLDTAEIIVAVGQGLEKQEDLAAVEAIAEALGGQVGCSKPLATDKKWLAEDRVIGLSGKKCKPELAILLGISGQVQFNVGIRDARRIVSINNDENAYINQMADYVMVADLKDMLPQLIKGLN